jgi:hypothetical protein
MGEILYIILLMVMIIGPPLINLYYQIKNKNDRTKDTDKKD